jgi:hypothetical protein
MAWQVVLCIGVEAEEFVAFELGGYNGWAFFLGSEGHLCFVLLMQVHPCLLGFVREIVLSVDW